jgi:hypothetical protein
VCYEILPHHIKMAVIEDLLIRMELVPGVQSISLASNVPLR